MRCMWSAAAYRYLFFSIAFAVTKVTIKEGEKQMWMWKESTAFFPAVKKNPAHALILGVKVIT